MPSETRKYIMRGHARAGTKTSSRPARAFPAAITRHRPRMIISGRFIGRQTALRHSRAIIFGQDSRWTQCGRVVAEWVDFVPTSYCQTSSLAMRITILRHSVIHANALLARRPARFVRGSSVWRTTLHPCQW